jgi:hypothetical protein
LSLGTCRFAPHPTMGLPVRKAGSWKLGAGSWELEAGSWKL